MRQIWTIARREIDAFFDSLIAYIMLVAFLGFSGLFTWLYGADVFFVGQASLQTFFEIAYWTLFFFIPALTMRLLAEERRSGTLELLLTRPVTDWQVVCGKFLSTLLLIAAALALTLPYYITVSFLGDVDHGAVLSGYAGLLLMSAAYIGVGVFASSVTSNQIVAFLLALAIGIMFHLVFGMLAMGADGFLARLFDYLSLERHFSSVARGVIDTRDVVYFLSLSAAGLAGAEASLSRRNVSD